MPWGPEGSENIGKPSYFNLPPDIGFISFTPIKGRINRLTVYIYKADTPVHIFIKVFGYSGRNWDRKGVKT